MSAPTPEVDDFDWRVTSALDEDGNPSVSLAFGGRWAASPLTDESKVHMLGRAMMTLGARLAGGVSLDDEDDYDDEDDD